MKVIGVEQRSYIKIVVLRRKNVLEYYSELVGTLNSRRAASPLVWLVEGEERWEAPDQPQGFLPLNWGATEKNRTVICMVLKQATAKKNLVLTVMNLLISIGLRQAGDIIHNTTESFAAT
ncbi:hypothetical protein TNCV_2506311 [Trichonephila clavipes]|uniref:Uncharacterized protein n=1 Tax=Trichonephila clavipes TaxID=2585209 RepID=A0A8X6WFX8_TRICX|nr:hypothetical protein TNCV_2506311 [Trichonephila clavipes]